jgi:polysaccharide biosynthesis transport protein
MKNKKNHIVEGIDVRDYVRVVIRRKWIIMSIFLAAVTVVTIHVYRIPPVYKVTTQLLIDKENPNVVSIEEVVTPDRSDLQWNQTEIKILSSRSLALRVINALNLKDSPEFKPDEKRKSFTIKGSLKLITRQFIKASGLVVIKILNLKGKVYPSEGVEKRGIKGNDSPEFKPEMFVAQKVIKDLGLREKVHPSERIEKRGIKGNDSPEFKPDEKRPARLRSGGKSFSMSGVLRSLAGKLRSKKENLKPAEPDKGQEDSSLASNYLSRLSVEAVKYSRLVNISYEGTHPEIITAIVNRHAQEYIDANLEMRFSATKDAVEWLKKQLAENGKKVEKAENALQEYKEKEKIVSLEERQNIIVEKLGDLNKALTDARTERMGLETFYNQTKELSDRPDMSESIPYVVDNPLIQELKKDYIDTKAEITKLRGKYGEKFPAIIKLLSQAKEQENRINSEVNELIKSLETKYKVALSKEESIANAFEEQKEKALELNRKAIAYNTLKRETESEKTMYDVLLKRMKETGITGELKTSNIRIIDTAVIPRSPIKPKKKLNMFLAAVIGLILGVGMAFLLETIDNTVKSPEDVEHYLGLPLLGVFEKVKTLNGKGMSSFDIITHRIPKSNIAEAFRNIRTNMMLSSELSSEYNPKKLFLVTSTSKGEGKTFVTANLATTIAQTGKKTLVVDTDFRNPRLSKVFNIRRKPGLSDFLIGEIELGPIIRSTRVPNLSIITCGSIPPNPSELLGSGNMEMFCKDVRERFDIVIFDTPPSVIVTDAVVLSNILDGVIFLVKSGIHEKKIVERAISQIRNTKIEILGVVMNYIDVSRGSYFYHYYTYYSRYGYGYGREEKSKKSRVAI